MLNFYSEPSKQLTFLFFFICLLIRFHNQRILLLLVLIFSCESTSLRDHCTIFFYRFTKFLFNSFCFDLFVLSIFFLCEVKFIDLNLNQISYFWQNEVIWRNFSLSDFLKESWLKVSQGDDQKFRSLKILMQRIRSIIGKNDGPLWYHAVKRVKNSLSQRKITFLSANLLIIFHQIQPYF